MKEINIKNWILVGLVLGLVVASRLLPHLPNMGVITALGIFFGFYWSWQKSLFLVLAVRFLSDLILGFFSWPLMVAVYLSHALGVCFGVYIRQAEGSSAKWNRVLLAGFSSGIVFYLVTNFAFLYEFYPHNLTGIWASYINALPFLKGTLVGDLGYTIVFFGAYELAVKLTRQLKSKFQVHA